MQLANHLIARYVNVVYIIMRIHMLTPYSRVCYSPIYVIVLSQVTNSKGVKADE